MKKIQLKIIIGLMLIFGTSCNTILWEGDYSAITISNPTNKTQEVKFLVNKTSPFGSFVNMEELLSYVVADSESDEEAIEKVYEYFQSNRNPFCSEASPFEAVRDEENLLDRLFSYSFACCGDVNTMLARAYELLGYDATIISNPRHVIGEVSTGEKSFVVDANLGPFIQGSFAESQESSFEFLDSDPGMQYLYNSIFVDDGDANSFYELDAFPHVQLPTSFPVNLAPGETISFENKHTSDRVVTYPVYTKELTESYEESVFQYLGNGTITHNLKYNIVADDENGCRIYRLDSPYVMIEAAVKNLDLEKVKEFSFSLSKGNWSPFELTSSDFTINYAIYSEGSQEIILNPNTFLNDWGGYSYRLYLKPLIVTYDMNDKREDMDLVLYEDGIPLPYPNGDGIIEEGEGRYSVPHTNMLFFSTTDNSDPRTNGREYKAQVTTYTSLAEPFGRYHYYLNACPTVEGDFSFEDSLNVETIFQYNRLVLPEDIQKIKNLNPETIFSIE